MMPDANQDHFSDDLQNAFYLLTHDLIQPLHAIRIAAESILYFKGQGTPLPERDVERNIQLILAACKEAAERIEASREAAQKSEPEIGENS